MATRNHDSEVTDLMQECCICGGRTTLFASGSAYVIKNKKEYRVFYHQACINEDTKPVVTKILNEMASNDK